MFINGLHTFCLHISRLSITKHIIRVNLSFHANSTVYTSHNTHLKAVQKKLMYKYYLPSYRNVVRVEVFQFDCLNCIELKLLSLRYLASNN